MVHVAFPAALSACCLWGCCVNIFSCKLWSCIQKILGLTPSSSWSVDLLFSLSLQCSYHWATGPMAEEWKRADSSCLSLSQFSSWVYEITIDRTGRPNSWNWSNFEHARPLYNSKCPPAHSLSLVILVLHCADENQNSCHSQNTCLQFFHMWQWVQVVWHISWEYSCC